MLVLVLCSLSLTNQFYRFNLPSLILSAVGIVGVALFAFEKKIYRTVLILWIILQLVIVKKYVLQAGSYSEEWIWNLSQGVEFWWGLYFGGRKETTGVFINFLPIAYFFLLRALEISRLNGKTVTILPFRGSERVGDVFPLEGEIMDKLKIGEENNWMLVRLKNEFEYAEKNVKYVLISSRYDSMIRLNEENHIANLRLVFDWNDILYRKKEAKQFPFVDLVLVK